MPRPTAISTKLFPFGSTPTQPMIRFIGLAFSRSLALLLLTAAALRAAEPTATAKASLAPEVKPAVNAAATAGAVQPAASPQKERKT